MLMIRYQLVGKKHDHSFRIILTEKRTSPHGKMQERLGFYNPKTKELKLEKERIAYWIGKGAQASNSVWNLFVKNGAVKGAKRKILSAKYSPKVSAVEEKKEETPSSKAETPVVEETAKIETPKEEMAKVAMPAEEAVPIKEATPEETIPVAENQENIPAA